MRDPQLEMAVDDLCILDTNRSPTEDELYDIYTWIDSIDFTRPKKSITRDFSDGVLMAELISLYLPHMVDLKNYYAALSKKNKANNWQHLNAKVFAKLGFKVEKHVLNDIMESKNGAIEKVLFDLRPFLARRNRSILNYRVGLKPEAPGVGARKPEIPNAMTYSAQLKRRSKTIPTPPKMCPIKPKLANSNDKKIPSNETAILVQVLSKDFHDDIEEVSNEDNGMSYAGLKRSISNESDKRNIERDAEQEEDETEFSTATMNSEEAWSAPSAPLSPPPNTTHEGFAMFGEELFLTGQVPVTSGGTEKDMKKLIDGIPGVKLGFYGLV